MIYAKDLDRMAAFYENTLGLRPVAGTRTDGWIEFEAGDTRLALHAIPAHIATQIEITTPAEPREETPIKLIFAVDGVDAELSRMEALGATVILRPWGGVDAIDPEGNIFHLTAK